ncbi:radical SAM protein [Streptomyces sp. NPDC002133]|uniref:radical SAM protein n=1 Tax=Streptomyces sp. NPDC002133 TaxID=3154409 RepID=UPI003317C7DC
MTNLGIPVVPTQTRRPVGSGVEFSNTGHYFEAPVDLDVHALADAAAVPLSVIVQVTKRCNFDCNMCSETLQMPDPTIDQLDTMRENLSGVARVFLSGGEPMMRKDFSDIVDMWHRDAILAVPTNATHGMEHAKNIAGKIAYANVGFEGPRAAFQRIRGQEYDLTMAGIRAFQERGIPISLSAVITRSYLPSMPYVTQIADVLDAGKIKFIMPLRKGNALKLPAHEFISNEEAEHAFDRLIAERTTHRWSPALRLTTWTPDNEGHMICIEPNGVARAWPVYDAPDLWLNIGNVLEEPVTEIWKRYPYKKNHMQKYLSRTISSVTQGV